MHAVHGTMFVVAVLTCVRVQALAPAPMPEIKKEHIHEEQKQEKKEGEKEYTKDKKEGEKKYKMGKKESEKQYKKGKKESEKEYKKGEKEVETEYKKGEKEAKKEKKADKLVCPLVVDTCNAIIILHAPPMATPPCSARLHWHYVCTACMHSTAPCLLCRAEVCASAGASASPHA